jgi:hypothetical protein
VTVVDKDGFSTTVKKSSLSAVNGDTHGETEAEVNVKNAFDLLNMVS